MEQKKLFQIIGLSLVLSSIFLTILSLVFGFSLSQQRMEYYKSEDIHFEKFSVTMRDGIDIKGLVYVDEDLEEKSDNSVPSVLFIFGVNSRKEKDFDKVYQLVNLGYAVFTVELRGHGESGGLSGFIGKEPDDMVEVLDYIEENYDFANSTHFGLYAFSFGGGVATVLQAIDDRIHASVIYHPLSSIDKFHSIVPFQNLIGHTPAINDVLEIEDGYKACDEKNTENLLLIHGKEDKVITYKHSVGLYEQLDEDEERDDIELELREGLDHGPNENDEDSLKYSIVWFEHFFHDSSININNRDEEIKDINLREVEYPSSSLPFDLIFIASILMFAGLFILVLPSQMWSLTDSFKSDFELIIGRHVEANGEYKNMLLWRSVFYLIPALIGGIIFGLFNPSYFYGYFLTIPLITIGLMLFIKSSEYENFKDEWKMWFENSMKKTLLSSLIIIIPVLLFVTIHNYIAIITINEPIPFFSSTALVYLLIGFSVLFADLMLIRGWKLKHSLFLIGLRSLTLLIFFLFVPIPEFPFFGEGYLVHVLIISLIGVVLWIGILATKLMKLVIKSEFSSLLIVLLPLVVFLTDRFFRLI
ncbi:MAG: hypothetical protein EU544_02990 [Promethearchaeota archaeon]|nr:MAG: hypothetical protein EU544_02990 [Candidatus Lokiarchaeota archaeon]